MVKIELIYDASCPNIEKARDKIRQALSGINIPHEWMEWDRADPKAPSYVNHYGSPTILVNESDVANIADKTSGDSCRLYRNEKGGVEGVPPVQNIQQAIMQGKGSELKIGKFRGWVAGLVSFPAIVVASLPLLSCPLCWPLYSSVLGSMGLTFFNYTPYLLPITSGFLLVALASIWYQTKRFQIGYMPFWLAVVASAAVIIGKFLFPSLWLLVAGVIGLVASVIWNLRLTSKMKRDCCCVDK